MLGQLAVFPELGAGLVDGAVVEGADGVVVVVCALATVIPIPRLRPKAPAAAPAARSIRFALNGFFLSMIPRPRAPERVTLAHRRHWTTPT